jgi:hypothetical protein
MFFCLLIFKGTLTSFFKDKKSKRSKKNSRNQTFSYYFCLIYTSGLWIRIQEVRIRNFAVIYFQKYCTLIRIRIRNAGYRHGPNTNFLAIL